VEADCTLLLVALVFLLLTLLTLLTQIANQIGALMATAAQIQTKLGAQSSQLDTIKASVDVLAADNATGATQAEVDSIAAAVDANQLKIDAVLMVSSPGL
jgi:cell division protein FtsB